MLWFWKQPQCYRLENACWEGGRGPWGCPLAPWERLGAKHARQMPQGPSGLRLGQDP